MKTTGNLGLKKPDGTDIVDIADLNGNMDILDTAVKAVQDHTADAVKHITAAERTAWNAKASTAAATTAAAGLMAAADKAKLDGVAAGANAVANSAANGVITINGVNATVYTHPNHTGDVTSTGDGVTAIAPGVIVDADVNSAAAIAWSKLSKTGASLADLPTRSAADLTSGTLSAARLPAATGDVTSPAGSNAFTLSAGVQGQINSKANLMTTPQQTTADITYYVRTDGSDSNTGLANTAGGAFKTIQKAVNMLPARCIHQVIINVAAGTYAENVAINDFVGLVSLQAGNTAVGQTNVQSITFTRCIGRFEANGFTGTSNAVTAFAALYSQQVILTTCWATAGASQNAVEFTFSSGRVQGGSYSNRSNGIVAAWSSNIYVNDVGGTGNAGYGVLAIRSSYIGCETVTHPTGVVDQYASSGSTIITNSGGVVNPWGDNTTSSRSAARAWINNSHGLTGGTFTKLQFNGVIFDQQNDFSTTLYRFTAKKAGIYLIAGSVNTVNSTPAGTSVTLSAWINGGRGADLGSYSTSGFIGNTYTQGARAVKLNAGDFVELYAYATVATTIIPGDGAVSGFEVVQIA
ncbi:hypothetical protein [Paenibacillus sp. MMS20-IR301]|uniref:hypothetical protein n=1 Tax=Paenibacillus sp. MMS20-IR301 TaxID=2895946 RepID=UPI0028E18F05|nr:hypothetical protein [Paenibacillus sp. MMS20-IR301]WNS42856.1 hypothetical protein LOS79_28450 [Paenibacillus sp. MMS20-IR301]